MEDWLIPGLVALVAVQIVLFVVQARMFRIMNKWIKCQGAHVRDEHLPITPKLIRVWKKEIRRHERGSPTYESYRLSLVRAGITKYGNRQ